MHLRRATIENIKSMTSLVWELEGDDLAGWHVILGGNGAGKTTLLRAIALALNGLESEALRLDFKSWLREGADKGQIAVSVVPHGDLDISTLRSPPSEPEAAIGLAVVNGRVEAQPLNSNVRKNDVWMDERAGWFSSSYGPFRRFVGGNEELEKLYRTHPKISRHLTLFGENVALSECTKWLKDLRFRELENRDKDRGGLEGELLRKLIAFINTSELLPDGTTMNEVTADGVVFRDAGGAQVSVDDLSDGYRSVLSMTFELIRQLHRAYKTNIIIFDEQLRVDVPGVVMIDEVDVHLHPSWQRRIGAWFTDRFPRIQFIVTTHSPLICHAAERGSIFRLPESGSPEKAGFIEGVERQRLIYGNALDAYATSGFGHVSTRSAAGDERLERLAELNTAALLGSGLSSSEQLERNELERIFASS